MKDTIMEMPDYQRPYEKCLPESGNWIPVRHSAGSRQEALDRLRTVLLPADMYFSVPLDMTAIEKRAYYHLVNGHWLRKNRMYDRFFLSCCKGRSLAIPDLPAYRKP